MRCGRVGDFSYAFVIYRLQAFFQSITTGVLPLATYMPSLVIIAAGILPLAIYIPSLVIIAAGILPLAIYIPSLVIKRRASPP
jgi:hypothetical protein